MDKESQDSEDLQYALRQVRHGLALVGRDIHQLGAKKEKNNRNRLSLLHIHAFTAIGVGSGMIANGPEGIATPAYAGVRLIPGAPLTIGLALVFLGIVLGFATYVRHVSGEIFALVGMTVWYLLFATSFAYAALVWQIDPSTGPRPSWQGMFAYYGWAAMLVAHLRVLIWLKITKVGSRR